MLVRAAIALWLSALLRCNCQRNGDIKLTNFDDGMIADPSGGRTFGRLQVYDLSRWETVCGAGFDDITAQIACRQMGMDDARPIWRHQARAVEEGLIPAADNSTATPPDHWADYFYCDEDNHNSLFDCIEDNNLMHTEEECSNMDVYLSCRLPAADFSPDSVVVEVGVSNDVEKCVDVTPQSGTAASCALVPNCSVELSGTSQGFDIHHIALAGRVCARRTDRADGWYQHLRLRCVWEGEQPTAQPPTAQPTAGPSPCQPLRRSASPFLATSTVVASGVSFAVGALVTTLVNLAIRARCCSAEQGAAGGREQSEPLVNPDV